MKNGKPDVADVIRLRDKTKEYYQDVHREFETDDTYHELDFLNLLGLPKELAPDGIVLPTARMLIDLYTDHVDLSNARVFINKKGVTGESSDEAESLRKFGLGLLYRTGIESDVNPFRMAAKHQGLYGLGVLKTVWDKDRCPLAPQQKDGEGDGEFASRTDEWRNGKDSHLPIVIQAINPRNIYPDYSYGGRQFIIEVQEKVCFDVMEKYKSWSNPKGRKIDEKVTLTSFWTNTWRCELADDEPILPVKGGVAKHNYGFIPYVLIDSGLGNISSDADPVKRYVGILRHLRQMFISESRNYSLRDITCKKGSLPWYKVTGKNADQISAIANKYGEATPFPPDTDIEAMSPAIASETLLKQAGVAADYIAAMAGPRSLQGVGESGVRSATHAQTLISSASTRFQYPSESFRNATAKVLSNAALIQKRVIPEGVRMWARTPTDEFDIPTDGKKFKEPITFYVEYAPVSEEEEYRKHDDLERLFKSGMVTKQWARKQLSNIDPQAMSIEEAEETIELNPNMQRAIMELAMSLWRQKYGLPEPIPEPMPQPITPAGATQPPMPQQGTAEPGRSVIAPASPKPVPGSPRAMELQNKNMRSQNSMTMQGVGGGGNRR
ncbi:MAG: hypothetical protein WC455_15530 [Dehalococcoidia bacterium]|jgi:hypothetical protein